MKDGWLAGDLSQVDAVEWVNQMQGQLKSMSEIVQDKETRAKERMKNGYDKHAVARVISIGAMVLVRTPDLEGKLSDLWDGPYEVIWELSPVVYELAVPSRRSKTLVAHINRLKAWKNPEALVLRVAMAEEEQEAEEIARRIVLSTPNLNEEQAKQLRDLLDEYDYLVYSSLESSNLIGPLEGSTARRVQVYYM